MCGICGCLGHPDAFRIIYEGLLQLQNRGYDSAGVCTIGEKGFHLRKYASTQEFNSLPRLEEHSGEFSDHRVGIGHTRWATHGPKTDENSHPHLDYTGKIALVHNGIIENYQTLKKFLTKRRVKFNSSTDSEVVANLIGYYYKRTKSIEDAVVNSIEQLEGTWGLVILCLDHPDQLICARHGSPLLVGIEKEYILIASEQSGFSGHVNNYISLNDHDVVTLSWKKQARADLLDNYRVHKVSVKDFSLTPEPYPHWTIKEIYEQPEATLRAMGMGGRLLPDDSGVKLGGLETHRKELLTIENLIIVGCGTSYYAGKYGTHYLKELGGFNSVTIYDGAEFEEVDLPTSGVTGMMVMSQSGETMDLRRALAIGKKRGLITIGVVNVVDSFIAREVDCGVYLNASKEVAVASTKSFTSQVVILSMIALWFAGHRGCAHRTREFVIALRRLPADIRKTIEAVEPKCRDLARTLVKTASCFVLGREECRAVALEGALKMKEIGYIHAEGYHSAALKHGPYSLLTEETPVFCLNPEGETNKKLRSTIEEICSRNAPVIEVTDLEQNADLTTETLLVKSNPLYRGLLMVIPLQLIGYYLALAKGHNPDFPRNLAKVVTVES